MYMPQGMRCDRTEILKKLFRRSRKIVLFIEDGKIVEEEKLKPTATAMAVVRKHHRVDAMLSEMQTVTEFGEAVDRWLPGYLPDPVLSKD